MRFIPSSITSARHPAMTESSLHATPHHNGVNFLHMSRHAPSRCPPHLPHLRFGTRSQTCDLEFRVPWLPLPPSHRRSPPFCVRRWSRSSAARRRARSTAATSSHQPATVQTPDEMHRDPNYLSQRGHFFSKPIVHSSSILTVQTMCSYQVAPGSPSPIAAVAVEEYIWRQPAHALKAGADEAIAGLHD